MATAATFEVPNPIKAPRAPAIDLDVPGALDALERDHPARYREVQKAR